MVLSAVVVAVVRGQKTLSIPLKDREEMVKWSMVDENNTYSFLLRETDASCWAGKLFLAASIRQALTVFFIALDLRFRREGTRRSPVVVVGQVLCGYPC